MKLRAIAFAFASISASALAQDSTYSLDELLTRNEGMTPIGDGLYARTAGTGESYVAVGPAGQQALREKLSALRAKLAGASQAGSTQAGVALIDDVIAQIDRPVPKGERSGNCAGPAASGPFYASATSGGGLGANAYASNSDATINTTNAAQATVTDVNGSAIQHSSTTRGTAAAAASAAAPSPRTACTAVSTASVTCPGRSTPSIRAFAASQVMAPCA